MNNTIRRIIFLKKAVALINFACLNGIDFIVYTFYRTTEEQKKRYAQGRTEPGRIVTYCDGVKKRSAHQDWLAWDIVIIKNGKPIWQRTNDYELLGKFWKELGGIWGGDWELNDVYHFEYRGG